MSLFKRLRAGETQSDYDSKILNEKYNKKEFAPMSEEQMRELQNENLRLQRALEHKQKRISKIEDTTTSIYDLVNRIRADDEYLNREKNELEVIFEHTNDAVIILDEDFCIKRFNKQAEKLFGNAKRSDIIGSKIDDFFPNLTEKTFDDLSGDICRLDENNQYRLDIKKLRNRDEEIIYISFGNDVTREMKLRQQLQKYKRAYYYLKKLIAQKQNQAFIVEELKGILKMQSDDYQKSFTTTVNTEGDHL